MRIGSFRCRVDFISRPRYLGRPSEFIASLILSFPRSVGGLCCLFSYHICRSSVWLLVGGVCYLVALQCHENFVIFVRV